MKSTQTGIAVALALIVVLIFFVFPGLSPFGSLNPADQQAMSTDTLATTTNSMPENTDQLQVSDTTPGTGDVAEAGDSVTVHYVGSLTDGTVFDASTNHGTTGFTFKLGSGQVIKGWDQGIVGMKVGGKRHLVIPAALAYGDQAVGGVIPAGSTLVFDVELLSVKKAAQ